MSRVPPYAPPPLTPEELRAVEADPRRAVAFMGMVTKRLFWSAVCPLRFHRGLGMHVEIPGKGLWHTCFCGRRVHGRVY